MKLENNLTNVMVIMLMLVMVSALSVVYVKYDSRLQFNQLKQAFSEQDRLGIEWGRLQLEHNTWSSSNRIEKLARSNLNLQTPKPGQIVYVTVK
jgi:cell division protein FtsL